jgi:cellulose synthase/poly-beta-1,6-N-acetylglucosamine synthase-like glycosyltransferase
LGRVERVFFLHLIIYLAIFLLTVFLSLRIYLTLYWKKNYYRSSPDEPHDLSAIVIVPCRGIDHEMEANLRSLQEQDYGNFHLVAVIDFPDDPASSVLSGLKIETLITERYSSASSGKVMAITTAIRKKKGYDIIVIADSDIMVPHYWLREMIHPFLNSNVSAVSTYPRFQADGGFWAKVKEIWGYMGTTLMEFRPTRFIWGGSAAFRRSLLDDASLEYFASAVSDDAAITKICRDKRARIAYAPAASPRIKVSDDRRAFLAWAERQMAVSIVFDRNALFAAVGIYAGVIVYLAMITYLSIFYGYLYMLGLVPYVLNLLNSVIRTPKNALWIVPMSLFLPFVYLYNVIAGARSHEIRWRGVSYKIR